MMVFPSSTRARSSSLALLGILAVCEACSSATNGPGAGPDQDSGAISPSPDGGATEALDGGTAPAPKTKGWSRVTMPAAMAAYRVAANGTNVWVAGMPFTTPNVVVAWSVAPSGALTEKYRYEEDPTFISHYFPQALAPLSANTTAAIGGYFFGVLGDGAPAGDAFFGPYAGNSYGGGSATYGTCVYAVSPDDVWGASRHGRVYHYTGNAVTMKTGLLDSEDPSAIKVHGLWKNGSRLVLATLSGLLSTPAQIPQNLVMKTTVELPLAYAALAASGSELALAVGPTGRVAVWHGGAWSAGTAPTTDDLTSVALASATNAFAGGGSTILHFDGVSWTKLTGEDGMPTADIHDVAATSDGTLYVTSRGSLYVRRN